LQKAMGCGFSSRATLAPEVDPIVAWAKLEALSQGATIAQQDHGSGAARDLRPPRAKAPTRSGAYHAPQTKDGVVAHFDGQAETPEDQGQGKSPITLQGPTKRELLERGQVARELQRNDERRYRPNPRYWSSQLTAQLL
jgi:hypothetical protein